MKSLVQLKKDFQQAVRNHVKREGVEDILNWLDTTDFYTAPASTRFHGSIGGGLVQHCLDVFGCLQDELLFIYGDNWQKMFTLETVAIVSLFHDFCKVNRFESYLRNVKNEATGKWDQVPTYRVREGFTSLGHGADSVIRIQSFMSLSDAEKSAIYWHMGAYDISQYSNLDQLSNAYEQNALAFALHRSDMFATYIVDNEKFVYAPEFRDADSVSEEADKEESEPETEETDFDDWDIESLKAEIKEWGGVPKRAAKRSELIHQLKKLMES